nr:hypothetical protein [Tanacetum cinerariifolium]
MNDRSHTLNVENFSDMLHICLRLTSQRFEDPPLEKEIISFIRDLGHTGEIKVLTDVNVNYMHQPWISFAAIINRCLSGKTTGLDSLCLSRAQILWGMYHKKNVDYVYLLWEDLIPKPTRSTTLLHLEQYLQKEKTKYNKKTNEHVTSPKSKTASASKGTKLKSKAKVTKPNMKKQPAKKTKAKGLAVLFEVPDEQVQKTSGTDEGTGTIPGVLDVPPYESESDKESQRDNEDDDDNDDDSDNDDDAESDDHDDASDDERTKSDSDEIPDLNLINIDQTKYEKEDVDEGTHTPFDDELTDKEKLDDEETRNNEEDDEVLKELYEDVNVDMEKDDAEMTDAHQGEIPNFASIFKFDQKVSALESELSELKQTFQFVKAVSLILGIVDKYLASKMKEALNVAVQLQTNNLREEAQAENQDFLNQTAYAIAASLLEFELKKILIDKIEANKSINRTDTQKNLYNAWSSHTTLTKTSLHRTKRRKSGKDAESSKDSRSKEKKSSSTSKDASKSQHKSFGKSVYGEEPSHTVEESSMQQDQEFFTRDNDEQPVDKETWITQAALAEEPPTSFDEFNDTSFDFSAFVLNRLQIPNLTQEILVGSAFNLLKGTCKSITELEYHLEECSKATTERLDWHNPENKPYLFDLRKPFLLIQDHQGRQIIPKYYFINKDLEYLKGGDSSRRYLMCNDDQYNRCSKKLSRVVSPTRLECIAGH